MATNVAPNGPNGMHTAGIFADMTVDGPEIGTLVMIVDRGKNLPNRRTMGKQNPYCAARLGKEAKKTETDKRGGQTPRWDQELRFTVHDSPDYNNLKISAFSEDKKTDLIGEAWVSLADVLVPGGGKADRWQGLSCKGKYAGEIRIELTYYDSRPKPEKTRSESVGGEEDTLKRSVGGSGSGRVKRRPLPTNPNSGTTTPDAIPEMGVAMPGRAKHGPRDLGVPSRANSMPPEPVSYQPPPPAAPYAGHSASYGAPSRVPSQQAPHFEQYDEPQEYLEEQPYEEPYQQLDFLPELPPSNRQRTPTYQSVGSTHAQAAQPAPWQPRPQSHTGLPHSYSAPAVPIQRPSSQAYDEGYQLRTDFAEPIPDLDYQHHRLRQRRNDVPPGWQEEYGDAYDDRPTTSGTDDGAPPPPPMHSNSAPIVPQYAPTHQYSPVAAYGTTPPGSRHHSVPSASPLQGVERRYAPSQHTPSRGHPQRGQSMDAYGTPPGQNFYEGIPPGLVPGQSTPPHERSGMVRAIPARPNVADPYANTPPRPHPLSQEVARARSPLPHAGPRETSPLPYDPAPYQHDYRGRDAPPLIQPRALSPRPPPAPEQPVLQARSSYNLQYPVRSAETTDNSPLSTSQPRRPQATNRTPTTRKPTSTQPSPIDTSRPPSSGVPFSPDSFDAYNPNAPRASPMGASPHTPYHTRPSAQPPRQESQGPIVNWHGQEIDPSDHLPVEAWAPEPEKKTPNKTYGLGRDRDIGPRGANGTPTSSGRLSKDTVVHMRMKSASASEAETPPSAPGRNRLLKRNPNSARSPGPEPLREHQNFQAYSPGGSGGVPDPYAQAEYSRGFTEGRPAYGSRGGAPNVPMGQQMEHEYGLPHPHDALAREISSIDIGSSSSSPGGGGGRYGRPVNGSVPPPTAYVPVRSHRDRHSYY
ncbi:hypothetical protein LTR59_011684 [Friedmanniomyces endolithicus]|nr:hypothetical protein LTR94_017443 [Friedmanniomyces endolithicus]KAK0783667.1 hypothetical protein LTR59_011684 [Friedmanniomyces endolithicus]KAK0793245.1 hypothetical protein LTR38_009597 [Friedmanniomyces endolithicus]